MKSQDLCEQVTAAIIAELEKGVMPWSKPWAGSGGPVMPRRHAGARYRGINVLILWGAAQAAGYRSPHWMTYRQALEYGACVKKGERSTQIVFANRATKTETDAAGQITERNFSFLKAYSVFNAEQIDKLPAKFALPALAATNSAGETGGAEKDWAAYATSTAWFDAIPAEVIHRGERAVFIPSLDRIELPERDAFFAPEAYFSTRAHETIHWTKAERRLNRDFGAARFGDEGYAMEELVAELGAAFTMAEIGHQPAIREDHAPYIAVWLAVLKRDSKAILTAAAKASDALDYLEWFHSGETFSPNAQAGEVAVTQAVIAQGQAEAA
jgi:antirestriction protein ArdC